MTDSISLDELQRRLQSMEGRTDFSESLPVQDLLPDDFVQAHTNYDGTEAFFTAFAQTMPGGVLTENCLEGEEFAKFVTAHTDFADAKEMLTHAVAELTRRKIGL